MTPNIEEFASVAEKIIDWKNIDEITEMCRDAGLFTEDFYAKAVHERELYVVRKWCRDKKLVDADGQRIELVSIETTNKSTGKTERAYMQLTLFDLDKYKQVIKDRAGRSIYFLNEARRFARLAAAKFGVSAKQLLLPFGLDDDAESEIA